MKFVFVKTIVIVFFAFGAGWSYAQAPTGNDIKTEATNTIQFIGVADDVLTFEARFSELPPKGCTFLILDDAGSPIYEELITGNSFVRRYKIARDAMTRISFKAVGKGFLFNQSFTLKTEQRLLVAAD